MTARTTLVPRQPAWQRAGTEIADAPDAAHALRRARLDWTVEQRPLFTRWWPEAFWVDVPGKVANVRADTGSVFGVVSPSYRPFQNHEVFSFVDALVAEESVRYESAGSLQGGRLVWLLARLPREIRVAGDDVIYPYMLVTNGHDGRRPLRLMATTVRVVCGNALHLALRRSGLAALAITHDQTLPQRVEQARRQLGILTARVDTFAEETQILAAKQLCAAELTSYFLGLSSTRHEPQQLLEAFLENWHDASNNLPGIKGSAWAAYNAVSLFADHQMTVRAPSEEVRADHRLHSIWFGPAHALKQLAYDRALELALAG